MRVESHLHPCQSCGVKTPCSGSLAENYDGWPEVICLDFHIACGENNPDFLCEDCNALPSCGGFRGGEHCDGGKASEPRGNGDGYLPPVMFCIGCATAYDRWRDNYEPPEPDGEAFRGGEAAAYQAEQIEDMRRLK